MTRCRLLMVTFVGLLAIALVPTGAPVAAAVPALSTNEIRLTSTGDRADPEVSGQVVLYKAVSIARPRIYWYDLGSRSESVVAEGSASYSTHNALITLLDDNYVTTVSTLDLGVTRRNLPSPASDWPLGLPPVYDMGGPSLVPSRSFSDFTIGGGLLAWTCSDWYYDGRAVWAMDLSSGEIRQVSEAFLNKELQYMPAEGRVVWVRHRGISPYVSDEFRVDGIDVPAPPGYTDDISYHLLAASGDLVIYQAEGFGPDRAGYRSGKFAYCLNSGTTYDLGSVGNPRGEGDFVLFEDVASGARRLRHLPTGRVFDIGIGTSYSIDVIDETSGRVVHAKGGDIYLTEFGLQYPDVRVQSSTVSFGDVYTGRSGRRVVSIQNAGKAPLTVTNVSVDGADGLSATWPTLPSTVGPGQSIEVLLTYSPTNGGTLASDLMITTDDPDRPVVVLPVSGRALTIDVQASELVELAKSCVANRTLVGKGRGRTACGNTGAFLRRLVKAEELIARRQYRRAVAQLQVAYKKCDGLGRPSDLVTGSSRAEVAAGTHALINRLQAGVR